jgi:hypothetical protein
VYYKEVQQEVGDYIQNNVNYLWKKLKFNFIIVFYHIFAEIFTVLEMHWILHPLLHALLKFKGAFKCRMGVVQTERSF